MAFECSRAERIRTHTSGEQWRRISTSALRAGPGAINRSRPSVAKSDELMPLLVPESIGQGLETRQQRDGFDSPEVRVRLMTALEIVVRDARIQMMNMMEANIAGKPLQDPGELIKGTALQRRACIVPILASRPVHALELMLNVEEPYTDRPGNRRHG